MVDTVRVVRAGARFRVVSRSAELAGLVVVLADQAARGLRVLGRVWLHWVGGSGQAKRHAPDFFARRADGTGVLIDVRPDTKVSAADAAVFADTDTAAGHVGWAYRRVGDLDPVTAANLRWLAGYRFPRCVRPAVGAALREVFATSCALRAGAARVGDPLAVLPTLFAMLWAGELATDLGAARLCSTSRVWAAGKRVG